MPVGLALVIVPLAVIILAQYNSLGRVQQFWAGYAQTWRTSYLTEVATEVEGYYRALATETFDLPAETFTGDDRLARIEAHFTRRATDERARAVKQFFVLPFAETIARQRAATNQPPIPRPNVYALSPAGRLAEVDLRTPGTRAILQACSPFQMLSREGLAMMQTGDLVVFERDP